MNPAPPVTNDIGIFRNPSLFDSYLGPLRKIQGVTRMVEEGHPAPGPAPLLFQQSPQGQWPCSTERPLDTFPACAYSHLLASTETSSRSQVDAREAWRWKDVGTAGPLRRRSVCRNSDSGCDASQFQSESESGSPTVHQG